MSAGALSALLLDLYRQSRELPLSEFQGQALNRLRADLPFDSAWWGVAATNHQIYSSFPYGLPGDYARFYHARVCDTDTLAEAAIAAVGDAVRFGPADFAGSPGLSRLTQSFGIRQALCAVLVTPTLNLVMFISLYRHHEEPAFQESEREFCHWVAPHLWATWTSNWIAQLDHIRASSPARRAAFAIADALGTLHTAEPGFLDIMRQEWPEWVRPRLPPLIQECLRTQSRAAGSQVLARAFPVCGLFLVEVRTRSPLDRLTPRERAIAYGFSRGKSHKVIALELRLSPATIRSHLRTVYAKLDICDKAQLANLVDSSHESGAGPDWEYLISGRSVAQADADRTTPRQRHEPSVTHASQAAP